MSSRKNQGKSMTDPQPPADAPQEPAADPTAFGAQPEPAPAPEIELDLQPVTDAEAQAAVIPVPIPAPAMTAAIECPGCGAKVRNIAVEPGIKIRCLNCGTRFVPVASNPAPAQPGAVAAATTSGAPV